MQHKWKTLGALVAAVVAGVFAIEGGFVNDPNDAGGATNHGITEQVARQGGIGFFCQQFLIVSLLPQTLGGG